MNTVGLVPAVYSVISIFLLDDALKTEMKRSIAGMESNSERLNQIRTAFASGTS